MSGLSYIHLSHNQIRDVGPIAGLPVMWQVDLGDNQISDLAALARPSHISQLLLQDNQITDLTPLITTGTNITILVAGNPIDCASQRATIDALNARSDGLDYPVLLPGYAGQPAPSCP